MSKKKGTRFVSKLMAGLITVFMLFALVGCGGGNNLKGTTWYANDGGSITELQFFDDTNVLSSKDGKTTSSLQYSVEGDTIALISQLGMGATLTRTTRNGNNILYGDNVLGSGESVFYSKRELAQKEIDDENAARYARVLSMIEGVWITTNSTNSLFPNTTTIDFTSDTLVYKPDNRNARVVAAANIFSEETTFGYRIDVADTRDFKTIGGDERTLGILSLDNGQFILFNVGNNLYLTGVRDTKPPLDSNLSNIAWIRQN